jgi:surface antigen
MKQRWIFAAALTAGLLSACTSAPTREEAGMVAGGIVGGVVGSEIGGHGTAGTIFGTLVGAALGGLAGRAMDESDRRQTAYALETVPTGRSSKWRNPDTGNTYIFTPLQTHDVHGAPCRDYSVEALVAGRPDRVTGTACRQSDGKWRVQG